MESAEFTQDAVLRHLGSPFVNSFVDAVSGARDDFEELQAWQPGWFTHFTNRTLANIAHDRIWTRLTSQLDEDSDVTVRDEEPYQEMYVGARYRIRVKRHHADERISSVATTNAKSFWTSGDPLPGLESYSLAVGYYWEAETRTIGEPVISLRESMDVAYWVAILKEDKAVDLGYRAEAVAPEAPEIDLSDVMIDVDPVEERGA